MCGYLINHRRPTENSDKSVPAELFIVPTPIVLLHR